MGMDEYESRASLCLHDLLKSAQSRPASLKYVKLLIIQFFPSFLVWT